MHCDLQNPAGAAGLPDACNAGEGLSLKGMNSLGILQRTFGPMKENGGMPCQLRDVIVTGTHAIPCLHKEGSELLDLNLSA